MEVVVEIEIKSVGVLYSIFVIEHLKIKTTSINKFV